MTIGPLQLVFIKFPDESRTGPISGELRAVRKTGVIRLVDLLYVYKDMDGVLRSKNVSDLAEARKAEYGIVLQGLMGIREAHKTQGDADKITAAMSFSAGEFGLTSEHVQEIAKMLPLGGSAILALFEHTWAIRLKEALLNSGGELIAQGLLSPEVMALAGTTLQNAIDAAQKIEDEAGKAAATETAEADQKLAEAQRIINDAEVQAAAKLAQAKIISDAAIAAGVRTAAEELEQADQHLEKSKQEAAKNVMIGKGLATMQVQAGKEIARQEVEQGKETAEKIKSAAALEALRILMEAQFIKRESIRQAMSTLVAASMIEQAVADESYAALLASPDQPEKGH